MNNCDRLIGCNLPCTTSVNPDCPAPRHWFYIKPLKENKARKDKKCKPEKIAGCTLNCEINKQVGGHHKDCRCHCHKRKCEQCGEIEELKKDIYGKKICEHCLQVNIEEGRYLKMD